MIKHFFAAITGNVVSLIGTLLIVVSLLLIGALFFMQGMGFEGGAYLGILTFVLLPMMFLLGLALVPIGLWWRKRSDARLAAQGQQTGHLPVFDLNQERTRGVLIGFVALAIPLLALAAGLTFKAVHYMDSTEFCGNACHRVMEPEYTAFQRSPHVRVGCAGCHIGPGAEWFVKAKISGSWQLIAVAFDLYPRPIPTPVHSLRPSNGTCEQCHWPTKFVGERLKVRTHFQDDEANTEVKTALMVKVGGSAGGESHGIHWHVDPNHIIRYLSDEKRETIYDIELTDKKAGTTKDIQGPGGRAGRIGMAHDGLRGLPQPSGAQLPQPRVRGGPGDIRGPHRQDTAIHQARGRAHPDREGVRVTRRGPRRYRGRGQGVLREELPRPCRLCGSRAGRQDAWRRVLLEQFPAHEGGLEHVPESPRTPDSRRVASAATTTSTRPTTARRSARSAARAITSWSRKRAIRNCCRN